MQRDFSLLTDEQLKASMEVWQNVQKRFHPDSLEWSIASKSIHAIHAENQRRYPAVAA